MYPGALQLGFQPAAQAVAKHPDHADERPERVLIAGRVIVGKQVMRAHGEGIADQQRGGHKPRAGQHGAGDQQRDGGADAGEMPGARRRIGMLAQIIQPELVEAADLIAGFVRQNLRHGIYFFCVLNFPNIAAWTGKLLRFLTPFPAI